MNEEMFPQAGNAIFFQKDFHVVSFKKAFCILKEIIFIFGSLILIMTVYQLLHNPIISYFKKMLISCVLNNIERKFSTTVITFQIMDQKKRVLTLHHLMRNSKCPQKLSANRINRILNISRQPYGVDVNR